MSFFHIKLQYLWYLPCLLALLLCSCQSSRYTFRHAVTYFEEPAKQVSPQLEWEIEQEGISDEQSTNQIRFVMEIKNTSQEKVSLHTQSFELIDDDQRKATGKVEGEYAGMQRIEIHPQTSAKVAVQFLLAEPYDFARIGSLKLLWVFEQGTYTFRCSSKFIRHAVEYREVYVPSYPWGYWNWGFYYHYHGGHHGHH